ncbi:MAG: hypothetical protein JSS27_09850 [Planctomycetes bacterium]|nr:hypothetical protein [Planctomycetota bacterium]
MTAAELAKLQKQLTKLAKREDDAGTLARAIQHLADCANVQAMRTTKLEKDFQSLRRALLSG